MNKVRQIIREEMGIVSEGDKEQLDHDGIKKVVNSAADLLKALNSFETKATEKQKAGVLQLTSGLKAALEVMVNGPGGYVDMTPKGPKKIVFSKPKVEDSGLKD